MSITLPSGRVLKTHEPLREYCDFCGKARHEVFYIVAGPTVGICDECIPLCADVIASKRAHSSTDRAAASEATDAGSTPVERTMPLPEPPK